MELALGLSTALSRTPATQRSGVEGDPGPSARLAKRRLLFLSQRSPSGRGGRAPSPRAFPPRRRSSRCQRAGGAGRQGPAHFSLGCQLTWRPARRFLTKVLRDLSAVGSPHRTLALPEVSAQARSDASGHLPIRFQPFGSPAVVRGGRIRRRWSSDTRGPPNWPWPPEPGGHVPFRPQAPLPSHPNDASRERPPADGTGKT